MFLKYVPNGYIDIELDQICENNLKTDHEFEHVQPTGSNSTHYATLA